MPSLWEVLKTSKGLPAPDGFTALFAHSLSDTYTLAEISGIPPLNLGEVVEIVDYTIEGNIYQSDNVTPDTPQEVKGVGERTGTLVKDETATAGYYLDSSGTLNISSHAYLKYLRPVEVKPNTTYTLSTNSTIYSYWTADVSDITKVGVRCAYISNSKTVITTGENERYLRISIDERNEGFKWIMLNEGSTPLPYEPYGYKVDVISRGKNLFDISTIEAGRIDDTGKVGYISQTSLAVSGNTITFSTTSNWRGFVSDYIEINGVKPIISYGSFTSNENAVLNGFLYYYDADKQYLGNTSEYLSSTKYARISFQSDVIVTNAVVSDIQAELGSIATEYSPYVEPITTPLYLDSPLYKIGDYADSVGMTEEVRVIKELVLTGGEDWRLQSINQHGLANLYINVSPLFVANSTALCSHFTAQKTLIAQTTDEGIYLSNNNSVYIRIKQERASTATDFKAWLAEQYAAGTPVKVYYVLATPEVTEVDAVEIPTLNGTTVIDVDTEVKPSNLKITYKSKM